MSTFYAEYPVTSGGSSGVSSLNGQTGALTLVAGSNITITPGSGTLTIDSTGGSGGGFTVFALTNDQETPANVTGLILDPLISSTYDIWIYTYYFTTGPGAVEGGRSGYYSFNYSAQAGTWSVISNAVAYSTDATISFNVTGGGQVQYTNSDVTNGGATGDTVGEYNLYWQIAAPSGASGGSGASTALDNLVTTSINQSLIPNSDAGFTIGDTTAGWDVGYFYSLSSPDEENVLSLDGSVYIDSAEGFTINDNGSSQGVVFNTDVFVSVQSPSATAATALRFYDDDNSHYVALKSAGTVSADATLILPSDVGTAGQVLSTDGMNPATLSWIDQTGGGGSPGGSDGNIQFNSSGSFAGDSIFNWAPNNSASHNQIQLGTPHNVPGFLGINTGGTDDAFFVAYGATSSEPAMVFKFNNGNATLQGTNGNFSGIGGLSLQPQGGDLLLGNASSIWPATDGTSGQVLATDGASNLSWVDQSGSGGANTTLSNLGSTAINADLIFVAGTAGSLKTAGNTTDTRELAISSGTVTSGSGGQSGNISLFSGVNNGGGASGTAQIATGATSDDPSGGISIVTGGNSTTGTSKSTGSVTIASGNILAAGDSSVSGDVLISSGQTGSGNSSNSGAATFSTGDSAYQSGDTNIWTGAGSIADAYSGDITLYTGTVTGVGVRGRIRTNALGFQLSNPDAEPAADVSVAGMIRFVPGGAGVADALKICVKDAADAYSWKTVTLI